MEPQPGERGAPLIALLALPQAAEPDPVWHVLLDNALALTVLVVFLAAAIGTVLRYRRKDKCLALLDDHHVTFLGRGGAVMWGDLVVYSQGLELRFDAPHRTRRGHVKSSALLYASEISRCLALCRLDLALSDGERAKRARQVRRSFQPSLLRRWVRATRNFFEAMRGAISQAITALVDSFAKSRGATGISKKENPDLAKSLVGESSAYDPMLERHIGRPVILRVDDPDSDAPAFEVSGYLVDYTEDWVAVFNVEHVPLATETLAVSGDLERDDLELTLEEATLRVRNPGTDLLVVQSARMGTRLHDLGVALFPGSRLELVRPAGAAMELTFGTTRTFDVVCPRSVGTVYFGSDGMPSERHPNDGLSPMRDEEPEEGPVEESNSGRGT